MSGRRRIQVIAQRARIRNSKKLPSARRLIIRDWRGLPAKRIFVERAARLFGLLMNWIKCNGICVITEAGKPAIVLVSTEDKELTKLIFAIVAVKAARRRNPGSVFTLADELFGSRRALTGGWRRRFGARQVGGRSIVLPRDRGWKKC